MNGKIEGKRTGVGYSPCILGTVNQTEKLVCNLTESRLKYCTTCTNNLIVRRWNYSSSKKMK